MSGGIFYCKHGGNNILVLCLSVVHLIKDVRLIQVLLYLISGTISSRYLLDCEESIFSLRDTRVRRTNKRAKYILPRGFAMRGWTSARTLAFLPFRLRAASIFPLRDTRARRINIRTCAELSRLPREFGTRGSSLARVL